MIYNLIITALLIGAFFMCVKAYTIGFRHGNNVSKGITPEININPIKPIIKLMNDTANKDEVKQHQEAINKIFSYSSDTAIEAMKKERR